MNWALRLWNSTIGKKAVMAVTGVILFGFVVAHMLGNLQIFIPDHGAKINDYGRFLHTNMGLLWGARLVLLTSVILHIVASAQLVIRNRAARPVPYAGRRWREADFAARTMMLSGPIIFFFVVYHLLHFTTGQVHPDFKMQPDPHAQVQTKTDVASDAAPAKAESHIPDVHHNVIAGFSDWKASGAYIIAMLLLGMHLSHGVWSMLQTLGLNHPKYTPLLKIASRGFAALVTFGNIAIPISVMAHWVD